MWLLTYDGRREDTSARHPEMLTMPASDSLQEACRHWGGENRYGKPNFRLVIVSSRFMIAGGHEFTFRDMHGNYQKTCPAEMLVPRYLADKTEWGLYVLECWRPPEWFYREGFAGRADDVDYTPMGKAIRRMEPVWSEGGYEACYWDANQLFVFSRDMSGESGTISLAWAIRAVQRVEDVKKEQRRRAILDEEAKTREKEIEESTEISLNAGRANLFLEPAISLAGVKNTEELWKKKESCASEPATP